MESPDTWTLLTSSLAVSKLGDVGKTWAFLVSQGLISSRDSGLLVLRKAVEEVEREGEITGPSEARRVAGKLHSAGLAAPLADEPDPWAKTAKLRIEVLRGWSE